MKRVAAGLIVLGLSMAYYIWHKPTLVGEIPGYVEKREVNLAFLVPGKIQYFFVDESAIVEEGQALAQIDPQAYRYEAEQALADLSDKQAQWEFAKKEFKRQEELFFAQANTPRDYDQALMTVERAEAARDLSVARLGSANYQLQQTTLYSPSAGVITRRLQEPGAVVANTPVLSLTLQNPVWIRAYASLDQLSSCNPGSTVLVKTDSGKQYVGRIGYISPQAEFTPKTIHTVDVRPQLVYRLRVVVEAEDAENLRQGIPVTVTLTP